MHTPTINLWDELVQEASDVVENAMDEIMASAFDNQVLTAECECGEELTFEASTDTDGTGDTLLTVAVHQCAT